MQKFSLFTLLLLWQQSSLTAAQQPGDILLVGGTCVVNQVTNPLANVSSKVNAPVRPLYAAQTVSVQRSGTWYLIGGSEISGDPEPTVTAWSSVTGETKPRANMTTARIHHTATDIGNNNNIIVCGGMNACTQSLASCEMYDVTYDMWVALGDMPTGARRVHAASPIAGGSQGTRRLLMAGGMSPQLSSAIIYDWLKGQWKNAANLIDGRYGHSMVPYNGGNNVLLCGGGNTLDSYDSCESYDVQADTWSRMAPMTVSRFGAVATYAKDMSFIWLVGGMDQNDNQLATVEAYDVVHNVSQDYGSVIQTACSFMSPILI